MKAVHQHVLPSVLAGVELNRSGSRLGFYHLVHRVTIMIPMAWSSSSSRRALSPSPSPSAVDEAVAAEAEEEEEEEVKAR